MYTGTENAHSQYVTGNMVPVHRGGYVKHYVLQLDSGAPDAQETAVDIRFIDAGIDFHGFQKD